MTSPRGLIRAWLRAGAPAGVVLACALAVPATASSPGSLQQKLNGAQQREHALRGAIGADSANIARLQGHIADIQQRLIGLESSLAVEQRLLATSQAELRSARARLQRLKTRFRADRRALAAQLVAEYEADRPDILSVVLDAHGMADLLERADALKAVGRRNAEITSAVRSARTAVAAQTKRLAAAAARQREITQAQLIQTREVQDLRAGLVERQLEFIRARDTKRARLVSVRAQRQTLEHKLDALQARAASTAIAGLPVTGGGGAYGFFPAAGTNYSVGNEPAIAQRLDRLGKALHLHLIGISGYRSPAHSIEVGGFADDPHTRGEASDTPGVEGVSEATLNRFGLTRPFPGAREADHIQLA